MDLSRKMSYEQFSAKVGEYLKVDPTHIRFSTVNATTGKVRTAVKRNANQNLCQILTPQFGTYSNNNQRDDALYYEILDMSLSEYDTKKNLKVTWVTEGVSKEVCTVGTSRTKCHELIVLLGNLRHSCSQSRLYSRSPHRLAEESKH